jgi:hypothetical protein
VKKVAKSLMMFLMAMVFTAVIMVPNSLAVEPDMTDINKVAGQGLHILQMLGGAIAVLILAVYGIKWFFASPQEKATLQSNAWLYVVGALLIYGGPIIMGWVGAIFTNINLPVE